MRSWDPINERQLGLLRRIGVGGGDELDVRGEGLERSLYALRDRTLINARRRRGEWEISITDAGKFYLNHGYHPSRPSKTLDQPQNDHEPIKQAGIVGPTDTSTEPASPANPASATHDIAWMSEQIGMTTDWIYKHRDEIPHHRFGRSIRFTDKDLATYLDMTAWRPQLMVTTGPRRRRETTDRPWPVQTTGRRRRVY